MKQDYEGQGLERFARTVGVLAAVGVLPLWSGLCGECGHG